MNKKPKLKQGDLCLFNLDPGIGHEFQGKRPALVIQANGQISKSNLLTIVPLTSNVSNCLDDDLILKPDSDNKLYAKSVIKVYNIMSVDYARYINKIGVSANDTLTAVKNYLKKHFDI